MATHTHLPIYKAAYSLLDVVTDLVKNMQRDFKRSIGEKISNECIEIMVLVFRANVSQDKYPHLMELLERLQVIELMIRLAMDKRLFNAPANQGLPIGNLSSQFFANVFLDDLDQFVKHELRAPHYIRYVDDFILLHQEPAWLSGALKRIADYLPEQLGVQLNPRKTILQPVDRGVDFVGHVIKPWRRTTRRRTVKYALRNIATTADESLFETGNSYLGLVGQASHPHTDRARIANALLARGHTVKSDLTKIYRKANSQK